MEQTDPTRVGFCLTILLEPSPCANLKWLFVYILLSFSQINNLCEQDERRGGPRAPSALLCFRSSFALLIFGLSRNATRYHRHAKKRERSTDGSENPPDETAFSFALRQAADNEWQAEPADNDLLTHDGYSFRVI